MRDTQWQRDAVDRFINATEQAKDALERKYQREFKGLGAARLHAIERGDRVVKHHASALDLLVKLRNVIQHSRVNDGLPIAIPRDDAVDAMEKIAELIQFQPQIKDFMIRAPETLSPDSSLEEASDRVVRLDLSQLPVYLGAEYFGLFTTNAMARWLGYAIRRGEGALLEENVRISEILEQVEAHETPRFAKPIEPALKVCEMLSNENAPPALLVTTDGTSAGQLQGIVTRFDVAGILRKAMVTYP